MTQAEEVRLAVPAAPEFLRLARVTASGLASRLGFTYEEVEDLRLAVDEACFALIGRGRPGLVHLTYSISPAALEIIGEGHFEEAGPPPQLSELSQQILAALVDEYSVEQNGGGSPRFRLLKRRT